MDDPTNTPAEPTQATGTAPAATPPEPQVKTFTSEQVEDIVRSRLDRDRKNRQKSETPAAPKEEAKPATGDVAELRAKLEFSEALDDLDWKPSKDDREHLRKMFLALGRDEMAKLADRIKPLASAPAAQTAPETPANGNGAPYKSPGAPAGAPPEVLENDATKWSADHIRRLQADGNLLKELEKYRNSLPGGGNGIFRKRIPK